MNRRFFLKSGGIAVGAMALGEAPIREPAPPRLPNGLTNLEYIQLLMQLHDKQIVSTETLLAAMNLDHGTEMQLLAEEKKWWLDSRGIAYGEPPAMG